MSYSSEVLADSPLAYWKLDEPGAADVQGGPSWTFGAGAVGGGTGLVADGGTSVHGGGADFIARRLSIPPSLAGASVSVSVWVNIPAGNVQGMFATVGAYTANGWGFGVGGTTLDNAGRQLILLHEGVAFVQTGYTFTTGRHHIVVTRSSANLFTAYVDDMSVWSGTFAASVATGSMTVGGSSTSSGRSLSSTVDVDDLTWFASVLSSGTVSAIYNGGSGSASATAAASPAVWLKLNETNTASLTAADATGNGRSATHNGLLTTGQPSLLGDGSGTSVLYDGGYTTIASAAWMDTTGVAVECRYRPRSADLSGSKPIVSRWVAGGEAWLLWVNNGKLEAYIYTSSGQKTVVGATTLTAGATYTVGMSYDGANVKVFLNGSVDATMAATGSLRVVSAPIGVACVSLTTLGGGTIDEVSIMPAALADARFATRHAAAIAAGATTATGEVAASAPAPTVAVTGVVPEPITGMVAASTPTPNVTLSDSTANAEVRVGVTVEVGALTLLNLVALPGVDIPIGLGVAPGDAQAVVPLPGVSVEIGLSLIGRQVDVTIPDPRRRASQWRYVMTDLANMPLGELTDLEHDPVEDGVGEPATMQFTIATDSDESSLIKPIERQCQVWDGDRLLLRGPVLPGRPSDDGTTMTYTIHDPSWFWRDGRRVITRTPQKNLLRNGDFKQALTYWSRGFDADSIPKAAPNVRVVSEDFADDTDGLNPIKAAEIFGVESVTESELSSNAVFWPNLATFRPGGVAAIEAVANAMPETAGLKVTVIGHTANDGTGNGLGLSARRAAAAKAIIQAKRPGAVITTKGVGFYDPKPGFPIDSQEQRRVVIQYDQTITGKSKQWMKQTLEVTQPKEARYPLALTAAAMLKVADDWSVPDANMMSVRVVVRRKSSPTKIFDEGSASISDTDPVDRWIDQTAEATVPADGRPYLVDVYLYAPAAQARYTAVGLFPDEQLYFWGVDQALIFKGVMEHIQDPEFGYADLGVGTRTPLTGIKRDREWSFRDLTPADTALDGLMGISRGIEWDTVTTATTTTATTFYPRQGKTVEYVLVQGGNVTGAVPANTRDVGSAVIAQAQGLGSYRAVAYASDRKAFGGTMIQRVVTAEQDTPLNELGETAKAELFWARSSTPSYWVDIDPDSIGDVLANTAKGDTVRLILDYPTPVDALARIVRRQIHPDSLRLMLAFEEV